MMAALPQEEALPQKLNFGIWFRIMKYATKRMDVILIVLFTMILTTFYDASFVPAMNASAISLVGNETLLASFDLWELPFHVIFIRGVWEIDINFATFLIT